MMRMMRMMALAALLSWLPAGEARAGLDPFPDSFGVYFDAAGNMNSGSIGPFMPVRLYLLASNPTAPIDAFECVVTRVGGPHFVLSTNLGDGAVDSDASADGFRVTRATPYPVQAGVSSSSPDFPVACINAWGCVNADERTSFGALKGLHR